MSKHGWAYAAAIVANYTLPALAQQLQAGALPIPKDWAGLVPVLTAAITALTMLLPQVRRARPKR